MPHFGSWAGTWWRPVLFAIIVDIGWMYIQLLSALGLARVEYAREL
jgi:fatty-acid desaturase